MTCTRPLELAMILLTPHLVKEKLFPMLANFAKREKSSVMVRSLASNARREKLIASFTPVLPSEAPNPAIKEVKLANKNSVS
jgi:hypothetical protein